MKTTSLWICCCIHFFFFSLLLFWNKNWPCPSTVIYTPLYRCVLATSQVRIHPLAYPTPILPLSLIIFHTYFFFRFVIYSAAFVLKGSTIRKSIEQEFSIRHATRLLTPTSILTGTFTMNNVDRDDWDSLDKLAPTLYYIYPIFMLLGIYSIKRNIKAVGCVGDSEKRRAVRI